MAKEVTLQLGKHSRREAQQVQRPWGQRERAAGTTSTKGSGGQARPSPRNQKAMRGEEDSEPRGTSL